jgi:hypothetical protein
MNKLDILAQKEEELRKLNEEIDQRHYDRPQQEDENENEYQQDFDDEEDKDEANDHAGYQNQYDAEDKVQFNGQSQG